MKSFPAKAMLSLGLNSLAEKLGISLVNADFLCGNAHFLQYFVLSTWSPAINAEVHFKVDRLLLHK